MASKYLIVQYSPFWRCYEMTKYLSKSRAFTILLKGRTFGTSLTCPKCQHHYSPALGPLLRKTRVHGTQAPRHSAVSLRLKVATEWLAGEYTAWIQCTEGWFMSRVRERDRARFHHSTQNEAQFKLINHFWNFSCNTFGPWLTTGNRNYRKWNQV